MTLEELCKFNGEGLKFQFLGGKWVVEAWVSGNIIEGRGRTIAEAARELEVAAIKHSFEEAESC